MTDEEGRAKIDGGVVSEMRAGSFFGELALLTDIRRSSTVAANTVCDINILTRSALVAVLAEFPVVRVTPSPQDRSIRETGFQLSPRAVHQNASSPAFSALHHQVEYTVRQRGQRRLHELQEILDAEDEDDDVTELFAGLGGTGGSGGDEFEQGEGADGVGAGAQSAPQQRDDSAEATRSLRGINRQVRAAAGGERGAPEGCSD